MHFKQFYLGCLAHASYLIASDGEAVVVDPQRDVDQYLAEAEAIGAKIRYIIETHLHADFVSGHRELAARSGGQIVFGKKAEAAFPHLGVSQGDELQVGKALLEILETPGHTPESICVFVSDLAAPEAPRKILTGDTLFIGDVGRPDLVGSKGYSIEMMASLLYDSLHQKILTLDDSVEVYPAHGAGSLCGKNISKETSSTIGQQRRFNYALQPMSKKAFVEMMTADLPEQPAYFAHDAELNRSGPGSLAEFGTLKSLSSDDVERLLGQGGVALDVRTPAEYGAGHLPGSINIGLGGQYASWAGSLIAVTAPIILVADEHNVEEARMRLARVGLENVRGFLGGGVEAWQASGRALATLPQISVEELRRRIEESARLQVIDVRQPGEYTSGHAPGATLAPLAKLPDLAARFDRQRPTAVICAGGYRSSIGTSLLERAGFREIYNVIGGTAAWKSAGFPVENVT